VNERPRWKFERDLRRQLGAAVYARRLEHERACREAPAPRPKRRRGGPNLRDTPHDRVVGELLKRPGVFGDRFLFWVGQALRVDGVTDDDWRDDTDGLRLMPDAFKIDPQALLITAYEVEDSHPVDDNKLARYVRLFWIIDQYEWCLGLVRVDKYGAESPPVDIFFRGLEMEAMEAGHRPIDAAAARAFYGVGK
jgi:hypothetical protein